MRDAFVGVDFLSVSTWVKCVKLLQGASLPESASRILWDAVWMLFGLSWFYIELISGLLDLVLRGSSIKMQLVWSLEFVFWLWCLAFDFWALWESHMAMTGSITLMLGSFHGGKTRFDSSMIISCDYSHVRML